VGKKQRRREAISSRISLLQTEEELGERAIGSAKRVHDAKQDRTSVFVRLHAEAVASGRARRYYKRALAQAKGLDHPSVVRILEGGPDDGEGRGYFVEEHVPGQLLRDALAHGPLEPTAALQVAVDVLNGLTALHHRGLADGALAPDSVLVSRHDVDGQELARGHLLAPGLRRAVGPLRKTPFGAVHADPDYAAPEAIKGEPVDARADVYSVGLLLQEALTAKHPIPAPAKHRVLHRLNETAKPLPDETFPDAEVDRRVRDALRRALLKDPSARFPDARAFALALAGRPLPGEPPPVLPDGGSCAACQAEIPPASERSWDRRESDRPFACPVCRKAFCGKAHWDPCSLTCKACADEPLPAPAGRAPEDVALELPGALTIATAESTPPADGAGGTGGRSATSDRLDALRSLLSSSKAAAPAEGSSHDAAAAPAKGAEEKAKAKEKEDPGVGRSPSSRPASSPGRRRPAEDPMGDALLSAWASEKVRHEAAARQADEAATRRHGRPPEDDSDAAAAAGPAPERPATLRSTTPGEPAPGSTPGGAWAPQATRAASRKTKRGRGAPDERGTPATPWKLVAGGLLVALVALVWTWRDDRAALEDANADLEAKLQTQTETNTTSQELIDAREETITRLQRQLRSATDRVDDLETAAATAATERADLAGVATARREELNAARTELQAARARAETRDEELAAARADAAARASERDEARADAERLAATVAELEAAAERREAELARRGAEADRLAEALAQAGRERDAQAERIAALEAELEAARRRAAALDAQLSEAEAEARAGGAPARLELAARALDAAGAPLLPAEAPPVIGGVAPVADRVLLVADREAAARALERAAAGEVVLCVVVELAATPDAPLRLQAGPLTGNTWAPDGPYLTPAAGPPGPTARFWIDPAAARDLLADEAGRLGLALGPAPGGRLTPVEVVGAALRATPVADDVGRRLEELRSRR